MELLGNAWRCIGSSLRSTMTYSRLSRAVYIRGRRHVTCRAAFTVESCCCRGTGSLRCENEGGNCIRKEEEVEEEA